jgi:hypothetical protein
MERPAMMDGEDVYRARLAECLAAAEAATLPQVRERHLAAARQWQTLLDNVLALKGATRPPGPTT